MAVRRTLPGPTDTWVTLGAIALGCVFGASIGLIAGYFGGRVDDVISRVVDVLMAFPGILLAIALVAVLGPSLTNVVLALSVIGWVGYARLVRGQAEEWCIEPSAIVIGGFSAGARVALGDRGHDRLRPRQLLRAQPHLDRMTLESNLVLRQRRPLGRLGLEDDDALRPAGDDGRENDRGHGPGKAAVRQQVHGQSMPRRD